ncbi:MAG: FMN-binding negative transcriptional regulator [Gemmataceae bacterium]
MYIPPSFAGSRFRPPRDFLDAHSFATLVTAIDGVPFASHLPMLLDRERGVLLGHLAKANPHWRSLGGAESLAIYSGPHAFVSADWYASSPAVPTWNFTAVHVYGLARTITEEALLSDLVTRLSHKYEPAPRWPGEMPNEYRRGLLKGIVGVELPLARVEGKFKLSQNRSVADRRAVIAVLERQGETPRELAAMMREALERPT